MNDNQWFKACLVFIAGAIFICISTSVIVMVLEVEKLLLN